MEISIIIPVYNRADIVGATLDSVVAQTHRPLQVVLVDNYSTDNTLQVLETFKKEHPGDGFNVEIVREEHHTAGAARNRGFEQATGEWVLFFDSDDQMEEGLVASYVKLIERAQRKGKALDLISARSTLVFPDGSSRQAPFHCGDLFANHILHGQLATQRYAVRREFFASTDGWNIDLPRWNDWELGLRLLLANPHVAYMGGKSRVTINHNGADSITGTEFHSRHGEWEYVIDIMKNEVRCSQLKAKYKKRFERLLEYRRMVLAAQYQREGCQELAKPLCQQAYSALRDTYGNNRYWRRIVAPVTRRLFARIAAGKRGSARIARLLY
ncbi:MAG: glycosyltransferase family 2 protein [Muribaculaceae bacterium]|nr:glycosyltransferase family 2 protein [Muribaculaceae bacterium]